jgi:hypothetical protein
MKQNWCFFFLWVRLIYYILQNYKYFWSWIVVTVIVCLCMFVCVCVHCFSNPTPINIKKITFSFKFKQNSLPPSPLSNSNRIPSLPLLLLLQAPFYRPQGGYTQAFLGPGLPAAPPGVDVPQKKKPAPPPLTPPPFSSHIPTLGTLINRYSHISKLIIVKNQQNTQTTSTITKNGLVTSLSVLLSKVIPLFRPLISLFLT